MDRIALHFCEHIREFPDQSMSMLMWGLAFLNCRNHGEIVASACLEEISRRPDFDSGAMAICLWASAILGGKAASLQAMCLGLKRFLSFSLYFFKNCLRSVLFQGGFWSREFTASSYSQLYAVMACWQAELGLPVDELLGHTGCRRCYEDSRVIK